MNKAILVGRLTKDPEARTTGSGISVTTFTVAVDRRHKQECGPTADFINCVCWRGLAESVAKYTQKGALVAVAGCIQTRSYDGSDGIRRYVTEILADEVQFLSGKKEREGGEYAPPAEPAQDADARFSEELSDFQLLDDSELPF